MELFDQFISHIFNKKFDWEREAVQPLLASAHLWYAVGFAYLPLAFGIREQSELFKPIRPLIKLAWGESLSLHSDEASDELNDIDRSLEPRISCFQRNGEQIHSRGLSLNPSAFL